MLAVLSPDMDSSTACEGLGKLGTNRLSMLVKLTDVHNAITADFANLHFSQDETAQSGQVLGL